MIAIIPARGNSKGLSQKNLRVVQGKTLLERAIDHAKEVIDGYDDYCGQVIVTSEDRRILDAADVCGLTPFKRSPELSEDTSTLEAVVGEVVQTHNINDDLLILLPTYPFRNIETTRKFIEFYRERPFADSALCCYGPVEDNPAVCFYDLDEPRPCEVEFAYRRQERQPAYRVYHFLVACHSRTLKNLDNGFFNHTTAFFKLNDRPLDIDTQEDLDKANGGKQIHVEREPGIAFYEAQ